MKNYILRLIAAICFFAVTNTQLIYGMDPEDATINLISSDEPTVPVSKNLFLIGNRFSLEEPEAIECSFKNKDPYISLK